MPTYTYQCAACRHGFDAFQRFAEDPLTVCPECGDRIRRVIQPTPVVFKGSGWYINDSKKGAKDGAAKAKDGGEEKAEPAAKADGDKGDKSETKGDKPADKSDKGASKPEKAAAKADKAVPVAAGAGAGSA